MSEKRKITDQIINIDVRINESKIIILKKNPRASKHLRIKLLYLTFIVVPFLLQGSSMNDLCGSPNPFNFYCKWMVTNKPMGFDFKGNHYIFYSQLSR